MKKLLSSLSFQIIIGLILGMIVGTLGGKSVGVLGELGKIVIQLIKASATPLLFFVIIHSILSSDIDRKSGIKLLMITFFNGICALTIGISMSKIFRAGEHLNFMTTGNLPSNLAAFADKKIDFLESFKSYFPDSLFKPFIDNAIISLILVAVFFGLALRAIRTQGEAHESEMVSKLAAWFALFQKMFEKCLTWLVKLTPLAVFGVVAKTIGEYGFEPLKGLIVYVGVGLLGLFIHIVVVYHGWLIAKGISIREFWRVVHSTIVYSIGVNSSLATLPLTLKNLHELKVSKKCATLGACVGTNLNNDGILLYEAMAVFFVAQASGIEMTLSQQILAAMACVAGTIGVAGIPEAGFITLALVLSTVGLPTEILPMILTVDWILGRARTVTNVLGDMVVSIALDNHRNSTNKEANC